MKIDSLPKGRKPKFKLGDLVKIVFRSDDGPASYRLKGDMGIICEVLYYQCKDYGVDYSWEDKDPYYLIEYKILPTNNQKNHRYISEENLRKVEND